MATRNLIALRRCLIGLLCVSALGAGAANTARPAANAARPAAASAPTAKPAEPTASTAPAPDPAVGIGKLKAFIGRLTMQAQPGEYYDVANELGPVVDELRQSGIKRAQLQEVRRLIDTLASTADKRLEAIENDAHDDESALESLYRSRAWDDLSFALAAFPYWRSWLDLELARLEPDMGEKLKLLLPASKGFKQASMQLFRPGLVYGGWLGVGYVEAESGHRDRAREIFRKLDEALATEPDSPIRKAVAMELRMLEAKEGTASARPLTRGGVIDPNELSVLKAEAFAFLQQSRKSGGHAIEAARRLKAIIDAGKIDDELLGNMMTYAQELSAVDIGAYTDLAGAEFLIANEHWFNSMQKYETFFKEVDPPAGLNLDVYRYRSALAAYKAKIYEPGVATLNRLIGKPGLSPDLDREASKLLYAIQAQRAQKSDTPDTRKALKAAAERFVSRNPQDPAVDSARLAIAQSSTNASAALQQIDQISSQEMKSELGRTAFQIIARDFTAQIAHSKTAAAADLARQGIAAWPKLPPEDKQDQFNFALLLEMRALVDANPEDVLKSLDAIEKKGNLSMDVKRAMVWSRLQLYDRMSNGEKATEYVQQLAATGIASWQMEYLFPWIRERKDVDQRLKLAHVVRPAVKDNPEMDRRFARMIIEDLLAKPDTAAASEEAHEFIKQHPNSGDAWRLLALSAEAYEQPFEADRAWGVITEKSVPTMPVWWEGTLSRIRIRAKSNRPDEACPLLAQAVKHEQYLPAAFKDQFAAARGAATCATAKAGN